MNIRILTLTLGIALFATAFAPLAHAQSELNVQSVGQIFVDATGHATGQNLNGIIVEANGVISAYTSSDLGEQIFSTVTVQGFAATQKIQGVGSSEVTLDGSNAVISLTDTVDSTLRIDATSATNVDFKLAKGIAVSSESDGDHVATLTDASGQYVGSLVVTGASGAADAASTLAFTATGQLQANLAQGDQVIFNARPVYSPDNSLSEAQASALAQGNLAANVVTEFSGSSDQQSSTNYLAGTTVTTDLSQAATVQSNVQSEAHGSLEVAYDLAYETLPAQNSSQVAVYADGTLEARVDSAAQVSQAAAMNQSAYFVEQAGGRTQVLTSTPAFAASTAHEITVAVASSAQSEAQGTSQTAADAQAAVNGTLTYYNDGKIAGQFMSGVINPPAGQVQSFTDLGTDTEVFQAVDLVHTQFGNVSADGHTAVLAAANADVTLVDDAYATMAVSASQETEATFNLSSDVTAIAMPDGTVELTGPHGYIGEMAIANAGAAVGATGDVASTTRLVTTANGEVDAFLAAGATLVILSDTTAHAHADYGLEVMAHAIAEGRLAGHVLAGTQGGDVVAASYDYYANVALDVTAKARGNYDVYYQSSTAATFAFEARSQAAFTAEKSSDVAVTVDGVRAHEVATAQEAIEESGQADYYTQTQADGAVDVIVNAGLAAVSGANIQIQSLVDTAATAEANQDAFGTFHLFEGGLAVGSFVSLVADQQAGVVDHVDMLSTNTEVFKSIEAGSGAFASAGQDGSSTLSLDNGQAELDFADTTSAYERVVANAETDVNYTLGADVNATLQSANVVTLTAENGSYIGSMVITDAEGRVAANSYFVSDAQGQVQAHLEQGAQVIFRTNVGVESELSADEQALMNQAIASGAVGGQVYVQTQASLSAQAAAALAASGDAAGSAGATGQGAVNSVAESAAQAQGSVTESVTTSYYSNVQIVTAAVQNRVDITVSSSISTGKTLIISLDRNTISGLMTGDADILVDGQAAQQASSYADVLNPSAHGDVYEYYVLAGNAGTQVLISFPHFSTHTVTLKAHDDGTPPVFMYATVFLGALVAVESVVLVRRRWS
ncbi:MAG: hypothetical protein ACYDDF_00205 [Thermoplasmatota archaeon]